MVKKYWKSQGILLVPKSGNNGYIYPGKHGGNQLVLQ